MLSFTQLVGISSRKHEDQVRKVAVLQGQGLVCSGLVILIRRVRAMHGLFYHGYKTDIPVLLA